MTLKVYVANLDSRGICMVGTIYVEDHQTLLYAKYISFGPHGYRKDVFKFFSLYVWELLIHRGVASFHPMDICKGPLDIATN